MSQLTGHTETIDGHEYVIYMLNPMKSHDLLIDIMKMIGPAFGPIADAMVSGGGNLMDIDLGSQSFSRLAKELFTGLDKKTLKDLIDSMSEVTEVDGKRMKQVFDVHFRGHIDSMYKWLWAASKVQWGNFSSVLDNLEGFQGAQAQAPQASPII